MEQVNIIGLDLAKMSFQAHGAGADGSVVFRKALARGKVLSFLEGQPRCLVAMEACVSAHYWGREISQLGHDVRLISPIYVKPFVKRQKNDAADAEAIAKATSRPTMRFVAVKSEEKQALSDEHQDIVDWASEVAVAAGRGVSRVIEASDRGLPKLAANMEVNAVSSEEQAKFAAAAQPAVRNLIEEQYGDEGIAMLEAMMAAIDTAKADMGLAD